MRSIPALVASLSLPCAQPLLFTAVYTAAMVANQAQAESLYDYSAQVRVGQHARAVTVKVLGSGTPGSGIIIGKDGNKYTVLTAKHVIKSTSISESPQIYTADGRSHAIQEIRLGSCLDIAELTFRSENSYDKASLSAKRVAIGDPFLIAGFSAESYKVGLDRETIGVAGTEPGDAPDGYTIAYPSVNTKIGWSGGGLFNGKGELIAIHGRAQTTYYAWKGLPIVPKLGMGQGNVKFGIPVLHWQNVGLGECQQVSANKTKDQMALYYLINGLNAVSSGDYQKAIEFFTEGKRLVPYPWFDFALSSAADDLGVSEKAKEDLVFDRFYRALSIIWTNPVDLSSEHCPYMKKYSTYAQDYRAKYGGYMVEQDAGRMREWYEENCK